MIFYYAIAILDLCVRYVIAPIFQLVEKAHLKCV